MTYTDTNDIPQRQNELNLLEHQAAGQILYQSAERLFYLQFVAGVIVPVVFAIVNLTLRIPPHERTSIAAWGALYGLVIMLLDELVFDRLQQRWKSDAAIAQEVFDTTVLDLPWNKVRSGARPEISDIHVKAEKWRHVYPDFGRVRNWYASSVGCVPLYLGRILCQRANLWWDSRLRRKYSGILIGFAVAFFILALVVIKHLGLNVDGLLLATSTLAPAFRWAIREQKRQNTTANTLDRLCGRIGEVHDVILSGSFDIKEARVQSREIQDDILDHRRTAPIGLSWIYSLLRKKYEPAMHAGANRSVEEYRRHNKLPPCITADSSSV